MKDPLSTETVDEAYERMFVAYLVEKGWKKDAATEIYEDMIDGELLERWDDMTPEEAAEECMDTLGYYADAEDQER